MKNGQLTERNKPNTWFSGYFIDPSIATSALGIGPDDLIKDLNTLGLVFETMAVRDLRVYADALGARYTTTATRTVWSVMPSYTSETADTGWLK